MVELACRLHAAAYVGMPMQHVHEHVHVHVHVHAVYRLSSLGDEAADVAGCIERTAVTPERL